MDDVNLTDIQKNMIRKLLEVNYPKVSTLIDIEKEGLIRKFQEAKCPKLNATSSCNRKVRNLVNAKKKEGKYAIHK